MIVCGNALNIMIVCGNVINIMIVCGNVRNIMIVCGNALNIMIICGNVINIMIVCGNVTLAEIIKPNTTNWFLTVTYGINGYTVEGFKFLFTFITNYILLFFLYNNALLKRCEKWNSESQPLETVDMNCKQVLLRYYKKNWLWTSAIKIKFSDQTHDTWLERSCSPLNKANYCI